MVGLGVIDRSISGFTLATKLDLINSRKLLSYHDRLDRILKTYHNLHIISVGATNVGAAAALAKDY